MGFTQQALPTPSQGRPSVLLDGFFTHKQLSAEIGVHPRTLRRILKRGEGPPRTILGPKTILYRRESVAEWLRSREQRSTRLGR
jgi:hypothetical protein